jgi:rare lipoprotein A
MVVASNALPTRLKVRMLVVAVAAGLSLSACASAGPPPLADASGYRYETISRNGASPAPSAQGAAERTLGRYKLGAPYEVGGLWYVPAEEKDYDEEGLAGVYGDGLEGKPTANGEAFHAAAATAAHATLPMPAIVEVTNVENGRTIRVRLNDRGAFKPGRLIDLSRGAADQLGFATASAKVRVRYVGPARLDHPTDPLYAVTPTQRPTPATPVRAQPVAAALQQVAALAETDGGYAVQAGAFSDQARADTVAATLTSTGPASVRPVDVGGRRLYRVMVVGLADVASAELARARVIDLGYADARVIRN